MLQLNSLKYDNVGAHKYTPDDLCLYMRPGGVWFRLVPFGPGSMFRTSPCWESESWNTNSQELCL